MKYHTTQTQIMATTQRYDISVIQQDFIAFVHHVSAALCLWAYRIFPCCSIALQDALMPSSILWSSDLHADCKIVVD